MNIGLVIPSETYLFSPWEYNYYFTELLRGSIAAANLFDCNLSILHRGLHSERGYLNITGGIDFKGLIIIAPVLKKEEVKKLKEIEVPIILINSRNRGFSYVDADNKKGASAAVEYLIKKGHSKIAFIGGKKETVNAKERLKGYKEALSKKAKIVDEYIKHGDFSKDSGYHEMIALLKCKDRPTAVFCANDLMALGAIKAVKERNLSVPDDISLVGFDDLVISQYFTPPLTSVRQPLFHMGKEALIVLADIINEEKKEPQEIEIKTRLIKRESVAEIG